MQRFATCMDCCAVQLPHLRFVQRAALEQHLRSFVWKVTFADATSHSTSSPAYPPQCQRLHIRLDADLLRAPHPRCIETMPHNVGVGQELPINRQSQRRASRRSAPESMERLRTENFFQHPQGAGTSARRPLRGSSCRHASSRCPSLCGGHGRLPSEPGLALTALPRPGCHYLALPAEVLPRLVADGPREAMLLQAAPTRGGAVKPFATPHFGTAGSSRERATTRPSSPASTASPPPASIAATLGRLHRGVQGHIRGALSHQRLEHAASQLAPDALQLLPYPKPGHFKRLRVEPSDAPRARPSQTLTMRGFPQPHPQPTQCYL